MRTYRVDSIAVYFRGHSGQRLDLARISELRTSFPGFAVRASALHVAMAEAGRQIQRMAKEKTRSLGRVSKVACLVEEIES